MDNNISNRENRRCDFAANSEFVLQFCSECAIMKKRDDNMQKFSNYLLNNNFGLKEEINSNYIIWHSFYRIFLFEF